MLGEIRYLSFLLIVCNSVILSVARKGEIERSRMILKKMRPVGPHFVQSQ